MRRLQDLPIRRKLSIFILLVSCLALVMAIAAVLAYELFTFKARAVSNLGVLADILQVSAQSAVEFNVKKTADETLNALRSQPAIVCACIYQQDGSIFAWYVRPHEPPVKFPPPQGDGHAFVDGDLILFRRILSKGEPIGTVYLRYDLAIAYARVPHFLVILGIVVLIMFVFSLILSNVLQRIISAPILRLTNAARLIMDKKDYSVRATKESEDELGQLSDSFNQMLGTISAREQALRQAKNDLEIRVRERTASLQESVQSLEGVLYHVAHDLRAPLRAMQGFTTILLKQYAPELDATGKEFASRISAAAVRMDELIQDLLEYGRLGHVELQFKAVDLSGTFASVLTLLADEIQTRKAEIKIEEPLPRVWGNPKMLEQVLTNLLGNALKFVASGTTPQIQIQAEHRDGKIRLWVRDNGIGIAPEYHERIFRVFERLHAAEAYPGTGIGLAIVRKGIERMGGQVGLESKPGSGSDFWIDLPEPPAT